MAFMANLNIRWAVGDFRQRAGEHEAVGSEHELVDPCRRIDQLADVDPGAGGAVSANGPIDVSGSSFVDNVGEAQANWLQRHHISPDPDLFF